MFLASSSQLMTNWISFIKGGISVNRNNIDINKNWAAKITKFDDIDSKNKKRL